MDGLQELAAGARRGAGRDGPDPRQMTQEEHLAPWLDRKDNRGIGFVSASSLMKEAKSMRIEEPSFELKPVHLQGNSKVAQINQSIVKKLSALSTQRVEYLRTLAMGAPVAERNRLAGNVRNLLGQIRRFQSQVEDLGGVFYPIPSEFKDIEDI